MMHCTVNDFTDCLQIFVLSLKFVRLLSSAVLVDTCPPIKFNPANHINGNILSLGCQPITGTLINKQLPKTYKL